MASAITRLIIGLLTNSIVSLHYFFRRAKTQSDSDSWAIQKPQVVTTARYRTFELTANLCIRDTQRIAGMDSWSNDSTVGTIQIHRTDIDGIKHFVEFSPQKAREMFSDWPRFKLEREAFLHTLTRKGVNAILVYPNAR